ncbi:hypothetical protein NDA10_001462 [Ustilago hordei]|uniref:DNA mismatch repair protein MSH3 n=1 Tax=Ustilago hordei TaxID=120017 RepID=I2FV81_USTHO|nr:uncharacterized protein UHO2_06487 [Ustilago hordei]KAJ1045388.1 hypothetical protein NDA10_001462 [Ustilago hordei]CCF50824.1 related to DNA mismatch repair protein [Ustilago hordei]SYW77190.1 related to DNA mismatch repair protein [Ustilago hordei]
MPPPSQKAPGQATISAFFKPKPGQSSPSSSTGIAKASQPDPINTRNGHSSRGPTFPDAAFTSSFEPPHKRFRLNDKDDRPRRETIDRMGKWKFAPVKPSDSQEAVVEGEATQSENGQSQKEGARKEAFRKKLIGSNFAIDRHARNQMQIEEMASRDTFSPRKRATTDANDDDEAIVIDDDDGGGEEAGDSEGNSTTNRFGKFASTTTTSSSWRGSKLKGKGKATADTDAVLTYTPLEKQILELKSLHPGVLLIIEVGYKLKFYGEDARIASKELNIMCFPERNLLTAMIPVHRLHIHVKKLISAGHKVGVVRQIETRALKAASKNAYTPFVRKLTALYTAGTWIDDLASSDDMGAGLGIGEGYTNQPKSLMAIVEQSEGGNGAEDRVSIGLVSVEVNTGFLTYDQFSDGHARSELETRIAHLAPAEVLVGKGLSKPTEKIIGFLLGSGAEEGGGVRIERMESKPDYNMAFQAVTQFYRDRGIDTEDEVRENDTPSAASPADGAGDGNGKASPFMSLILTLPHLSLIALSQIITHLQAFQLESICTLSTNFASFSSRTTMLLNASTLANLEIFRTSDEQSEKGSLIWLLDKCKTAMGRRLLRKWVSRPLTDISALEERLDAVQALVEGKSYVLRSLPNLLHGLPDLERGLARMTYGRATPTELATVLLGLNRVTQEYRPEEDEAWNLSSTLLHHHILSLTQGKAAVEKYINQISIKEARANNKPDLFPDPDLYPAIQAAKDNIAIIEGELREHLREIRKVLHRPSLEFVTVAGVDYLVEVRVADAKKVPAEWLRVSATKSMVRFHTPQVLQMVKRRGQWKETLDAEADLAFKGFIKGMCGQEYVVLRNVVNSLSVLDVLVSLAQLAASSGYSRPKFSQDSKGEEEEEPKIEVSGMRHPILEVVSPLPYIPNDLTLSSADPNSRAMLLTGCNMGGKSSIVRTLGLLVILAQIGSFVAATSARLSIHDSVFVRMGARDSPFSGKSTFMIEVSETAEILRSITPRSLVILDELGRGTSTYDGLCIASGVLEYLLGLDKRMPNVVFISHYFQLGELEGKWKGKVGNWHMGFLETSTTDFEDFDGLSDDEPAASGKSGGVGGGGGGKGQIEFLYKLRRGIASKSFGIHCARLADLPRVILDSASRISAELERKHYKLKRGRERRAVLKSVFRPRVDELDEASLEVVRSASSTLV